MVCDEGKETAQLRRSVLTIVLPDAIASFLTQVLPDREAIRRSDRVLLETLLRLHHQLHFVDARIAIQRKCEIDVDDIAER